MMIQIIANKDILNPDHIPAEDPDDGHVRRHDAQQETNLNPGEKKCFLYSL